MNYREPHYGKKGVIGFFGTLEGVSRGGVINTRKCRFLKRGRKPDPRHVSCLVVRPKLFKLSVNLARQVVATRLWFPRLFGGPAPVFYSGNDLSRDFFILNKNIVVPA